MFEQSLSFGDSKIKTTKPIRLIELFAGIGAQAKALTNLKIPFEHWRVCEIDKYAICSYNAVHGTSFETSDITKVNAEDLGIEETDKYCYIMTYSFPCQDLSLAGKGRGMKKGEGTRSGLLWEVERILKETKELPQILLMENVPQIINKKNKYDFQIWFDFLTNIGYSNFYQILNARDYGIPQNRSRCFMISILNGSHYVFPKKQELKIKLKDLLEEKVDEKYFLSHEKINKIINWNTYQKPLKNIDKEKEISPCLTCRATQEDNASMILINENTIIDDQYASSRKPRFYKGYVPTITTKSSDLKVAIKSIPIKEKTLKGFKLAESGDGVYINRVDSKRGTVQKGMIQTLKSNPNDVGVIIEGNYISYDELRIRKLTPLECWRLMGFADDDFKKARDSLNKTFYKGNDKSSSQLYKQAGNSIVVNVLESIFSKLID